MVRIVAEKELRTTQIDLPDDYEERMMDLAIEVLADIAECDQSHVAVKWTQLQGKVVPLLYVYFDGNAKNNLPKVHIDPEGVVRPAHAICLAAMPSGNLWSPDKVRSLIRRGIEEFLLKYNVELKPSTITL